MTKPNGQILVTVKPDKIGGCTVQPVLDRHAKEFRRIVRKNGGPDELSAYLDAQQARDLALDLTRAQRASLDRGYAVRVYLDPFYVGVCYGYNACDEARIA